MRSRIGTLSKVRLESMVRSSLVDVLGADQAELRPGVASVSSTSGTSSGTSSSW